MCEAFHLIDLRTQAEAVNRLLAGQTEAEKIAWLQKNGSLWADLGEHPTWHFTSRTGFSCSFIFLDRRIFILGEPVLDKRRI